MESEVSTLKEHAGADSEFVAELFAGLVVGVEIVAYDGVTLVEEVFSDLMIATGQVASFQEG